jgi:hypothetical protein
MKPQSYYKIRSVVRVVFWSAVVFFVTYGTLVLGDVIADLYRGDEACEVTLHRDFSWDSTTGEPIDIDSCEAPTNVILLEEGRWEWAD